ncbi:MAG: hypothetical protein HKN04_04390 [Rhodothermaceae bacterium]|nr:hypothetical protein [Rhodothermaceae bacterium]
MPASFSCPECGAALAADASRCDLCGASLAQEETPPAPEPAEPRAGASSVEVPVESAPDSASVCSACGQTNPPGARFCNQCGSALETTVPSHEPISVDAATPVVPVQAQGPSKERPPSDPGRRALLLVGIGIAVVIGLYALTQLSSRAPATPAPSGEPAPSSVQPGPASVPAVGAVGLSDSLEARLVSLEDANTAASWAEAGRMLYVAALQAPGEAERAALGPRAVDAFDRSLALAEDPDVRTNLAAAALYDARNPMRPVQELQAVLRTNPDHVEANFNMGLLRMQIGRLDEAAESFRRVIALSEQGTPVHQEATRALAAVEQSQQQGG